MTDSNRPDGDAERLVRIETRLVRYQQANAVLLEDLTAEIAQQRQAVQASMDALLALLEEALFDGDA